MKTVVHVSRWHHHPEIRCFVSEGGEVGMEMGMDDFATILKKKMNEMFPVFRKNKFERCVDHAIWNILSEMKASHTYIDTRLEHEG